DKALRYRIMLRNGISGYIHFQELIESPIKDRLYVHYFTFTVTEPLSSPMIIVDTIYPDAVSDREGEIYEVVVLNIAETYISKPNINFINEMTYKGTDLFNARGIVRTLHELTNPQTKQELDYKT